MISDYHRAVANGCDDIIPAFIASGSDVDERDTDTGETALHIAAKNGHRRCVFELLAYGADRRAKDNQGRTPIDRDFICGIQMMGDIWRATEGLDTAAIKKQYAELSAMGKV